MSLNFLETSTNFIDFVVEKMPVNPLNWIGVVIQWLINGIGIIGLGIIVFTLILKTITMPLDVFSRVKMKKQSLIMKKMRPQMEKLQKQYANDKQMYNQKVMELQKANGISMLSSCLPMIVTLVIFMVVFSAFSTYSQFVNLSTYNDMVDAYNESVENFVGENGFLEERQDLSIIKVDEEGNEKSQTAYLVVFDKFDKEIKDGIGYDSDLIKNLYKQLYKLEELPEQLNIGEKFADMNEGEKMFFVRGYVRENARKVAADYYRSNRNNFLWVNSLWYPDSMFNKEVPVFSKFSSAISRASGSGVEASSYESSYNEVTYYLLNEGYPNANGKIEGNTYNGYFVLIVLAIGLMFLQQFIMTRSQKDANELSTVDGSGAKTNKWMMIMMPIIYGAFSFLYSAAFSLYMITNTLYSLVSSLIINKIMDVKFKKMEANGGYQLKSEKKTNRKRLK